MQPGVGRGGRQGPDLVMQSWLQNDVAEVSFRPPALVLALPEPFARGLPHKVWRAKVAAGTSKRNQ